MMDLERIISPHVHNVAQDPDLIEVLWRQDIDLGVGKEAYEINLREELQREQEIELQKERQKQKEKELLQQKLEEQRRHAEQRWRHDNFIQDGETGEWIPLGARVSAPPPPVTDLSNIPPCGEQYLSAYARIGLMGDGLPQEQNSKYNGMLPSPQHQPPQSMHLKNSQPMYNTSPCHYNQQINNGILRYHAQSVPMSCNINQGYPQQPQYNNNYSCLQHNYNPVLNMQQSQSQMQSHGYTRKSSLDATWQDLVNILELPMPNNKTQTIDNDEGIVNMPLPNQGTSQQQNTNFALVHNISMSMSAPMNGNITFNSSDPMSSCSRSSPRSSSVLSPCAEKLNSSMTNGSNMDSLEWNGCGEFTFPNITANLNQSETIDDVDKLLPDLITEDELEDINFSEMGLTDEVTSPAKRGFGDDANRDSAVSMGRQSAGSQEHNDLSGNTQPPFDALQEAIGGRDGSSIPKTLKYDPDDYRLSNSCSYSSGGDSNCSNFSSSSNDTPGGSSYGQGNFNGGYSPAQNRHIDHNPTNPQKPGSDPKDIKKHLLQNKEHRNKGPQSKDSKRIEELNIPFTVSQIVNSPVEEFNEMLVKNKFTEPQLQLIRDIRRRGKNKVAAQNCRKRKIGAIEHLEDEMTTLEKMRDKMLHERHVLDIQTREIKDKLGVLYSDVFHSLRDDHGQPYDPARYYLQQSSDGDMFLVPRNYAADDDLHRKNKSNRK